MDKAERIKLYKSNAWIVTRRKVLERDNYECQECKKNGRVLTYAHKPDKQKVLEIHHIKPLETNPEMAFEMANLETLCIKCHNKKEGRFIPGKRKVNKWAADERW